MLGFNLNTYLSEGHDESQVGIAIGKDGFDERT
jgi:hypothetical protein